MNQTPDTKTMIHPNKKIRSRGIDSSQSRNVFILRRRRGTESRKGARQRRNRAKAGRRVHNKKTE